MRPETVPSSVTQPPPRLSVKDLRVSANTPDGRVEILSGVSLEIGPGEALSVVGESGCGKTTTARAIMGILPSPPLRVDGGSIIFDGRDLLRLDRAALNRVRGGDLTMIPQDPNTSLNPVYTIGDQMESVLLWHGPRSRRSRQQRRLASERVAEMLDRVRLPSPRRVMDSYPFQLSGGMRQRVLIAMALLNEPKLIVADEPGSALDVTIQDQILELLESLAVGTGLSLLFITHNLGIARRVSQRVAVMYAGHVVEIGQGYEIFDEPRHPYTQGLLASVPKLSGVSGTGIPGRMPDISSPPPGQRFHPRCPYRMDVCDRVNPPLQEIKPGHAVACHLYSSAQDATRVASEPASIEGATREFPAALRVGRHLDRHTGQVEIEDRRLPAGSPLAFSARVNLPGSAEPISVRLARLGTPGYKATGQDFRMDVPQAVQLIAAELPADAFGAAITPGTYLLELASPSGTPMAWGAFEVIDDRPEPPIGDSAT